MDPSEIVLLVKKDIEKAISESVSNLKITAVDICSAYIVLGSNSGTLFFFNCENYSFLQKVRTKNGRIIQIAINLDNAYLGYASNSGLVFVIQVPRQVARLTLHPVSSRKHEGSTVTSLAWSHFGRDLYIGDIDGFFSLLHVPLNLASSLILNLSHYLMKLDSGIFQLDVKHNYVLISTFTKSYICNTRLETYSIIGTKSRFGEYGGCICQAKANSKLLTKPNDELDVSNKFEFPDNREPSNKDFTGNRDIKEMLKGVDNHKLISNNIETATEAILDDYYEKVTENNKGIKYNVNSLSERMQKFVREDITYNNNNERYFNSDKYKVFCSRPGLRVWEANFHGSVIATHQFKNALPNRQASVITLREKSQENVDAYVTDKMFLASLTFKKMLNFYDEYLLTNSASAFYLINPSNSKIILWCPVYEGIKDIKIFGHFVLVFTLDSNVHKYQITTIDIAILTLHASGYMHQCSDLCLRYPSIFGTSYLLKHYWQTIINDIIYFVKDEELISSIIELKRNVTADLNRVSLSFNKIKLNSENKTRLLNEKVKIDAFENKMAENNVNQQAKLINKDSCPYLNLHEVKGKVSSENFIDGSENGRIVLNDIEKRSLQDVVKTLALNIVTSIPQDSLDIKNSFPNSWPLQTAERFRRKGPNTVVVKGKGTNSFENVLENHLNRWCLSNVRNKNRQEFGSIKTNLTDNSTQVIGQFKNADQNISCSDEKGNSDNISFLNDKNESSRSVKNVPLPIYLKEFYNTVCSIKIILKYFNKSKSVTKALLILFLKEFQDTNLSVELHDFSNTANNDFQSSYVEETSEFVSCSEKEDVNKEITQLFLYSFQEGIVLYTHKFGSSCQDDVLEHSLTPKIATNIDVFYAHLISIDKGLINYRTILNQFNEVETNLMIRTWLSLMNKTTLISEGVRKVHILPDIEFSRSQRIQYLRFILEANGWDSFMTAVSKIQNSTVLFDVYYFFSYFSQRGKAISLYGSLKKYLGCISHRHVGDIYTKYWSKCPEVQTDIIISMLYDYNDRKYVCQCKYPLPNSLCYDSSSSTSLVRSIISLPLYYPRKLFTVFQRKYFYSGIFDIAFRYDLAPLDQLVPLVLQSFHKPNIICLLNRLKPSQYKELLIVLSKMAGPDDTSIKCFNCSSQLPICFNKNISRNKDIASSKRNKTHQENLDYEEESTELKTYSILWQLVYIKMIKHFGNSKCLQILQEMEDLLPQSKFLKRLFIQSIVGSVVEARKIQLDITRLASIPRLQFSSNIRSMLDSSLLCITALPKEYACLAYENSTKKVYLDSDSVCPIRENCFTGFGSIPSGPISSCSSEFNFTCEEPERSNHHWGVKTQILNGVCQLCHLGLIVDVMVNAGGLTVFACGHAFHTICLTQYGRICVICNRLKVII